MTYEIHDCDICGNIFSLTAVASHCPTCGAVKVGNVNYNHKTGRCMTRAHGAVVVLAHEVYRRARFVRSTELCDAKG